MPYKPRPPCRVPGCPRLALPGHAACEVHQPRISRERAEAAREYDRRRGSARTRGYDRDSWEPARARYLSANPWCRWPGCHRPANTVHHIIPLAQGGDHNPLNLVGFCAPHHSRYEVSVGSRVRYSIRLYGSGWLAERNGETLVGQASEVTARRAVRERFLADLDAEGEGVSNPC